MRIFALLLLLLSGLISGQTTTDTFEDGDLLNPDWSGQTDQFVVSDGRLRLNATEESPVSISLSTPTNQNAETLVYELLVDMDFAPSASNFASLELRDTRTEFGGVFVKFGGISGSADALEVSIIGSEGMVSDLILGETAALGEAPAVVRLRITRMLTQNSLLWTVGADYSGGTNFVEQGRSTIGALAVAPDNFSIVCNFTATRADRFSFDDVLVSSDGEVIGPEPRTFPQPTAATLIINEFLVDPNPPVGLPTEDFVELYNTGDSTLNLSNVRINSGSDTRNLATDTLGAGEYLFITNLPALNISDDNLALLVGEDTLHNLNYDRSWYGDPERDDGGYSLEFVGGPFDDLDCDALWRASLDPLGGTPGRINSVDGLGADAGAAELIQQDASLTGVNLTFDRPVTASTLNPADFSINETSVTTITQLSETEFRIEVPLETGILYQLTLPPVFENCAGIATDFIDLDILLPATAAVGDILLNEILFNPASGGADFVELINCSEKVFNLDGYELRNTQSESSNASRSVSGDVFLRPGDFLVLTRNPEDLVERYRDVDPDLVYGQILPTLPDDVGNFSLLTPDGTLLDAFDYSEDFHSELLSPDDGVSLERLRKASPTNDGSNWFSASSTEGFATPTRVNSQDRGSAPEAGPEVFSLVSETFSPDGDGFEDFLEIAYKLDIPGAAARITVFDIQGRLIRTLARTELLGSGGSLRWDGDTDDGELADAGAYVLFCELFSNDGTEGQKLVGVLHR